LFNELVRKYSELDKFLKVRRTVKGLWGPSRLDVLHSVFQEVHLERFRHFLDLGSGDGRVALLASLFTNASGIECDPRLVETALRVREELGLSAKFNVGDYSEEDLSKYDALFINPDKPLKELEEKLLAEFKGVFLLYNNVYKLSLKPERIHWHRQVPVYHYVFKG